MERKGRVKWEKEKGRQHGKGEWVREGRERAGKKREEERMEGMRREEGGREGRFEMKRITIMRRR